MATFKQFLLKERIESTNDYWEMIKILKRDCSEFLATADQPLFRGLNTDGPLLQGFDSPMDRKPTASQATWSALLDKEIAEKVGFMSRSQGTFVTSRQGVAKNYGQAYMFFPKNGFQFAWSPEVEDLFMAYEDGWGNRWVELSREALMTQARKDGDDEYANDIETWSDGDVVAQVLGLLARGNSTVATIVANDIAETYRNDDLNEAIGSGNEISFKGDYYMVNVEELEENNDSPTDLMFALTKDRVAQED